MIATPSTPRGQALRDHLAEIVRPRARVAPSVWAENNRHLKEGTTAAPGRWRNDYLPWLAPILDAWLEPWVEGIVVKKPAQVGGSELLVTLIGYLFATEPGPTLFLATTQDIAREFSLDRFGHMIDSTPELRNVFLTGKANRETTFVKPAVGGKLIIAGSGSPNKLISRPARYVFLDEEDRLKDFPDLGNGREIAEKRTAEFSTRVRTGIFSIAHPTTADVGVARTFELESDRREWHIRCRCDHEHPPTFDHVELPTDRPEDAVYRCPGCSDPMSDAQRWAATRRGRFIATRDVEAEGPARFAGFHFERLAHPRVPLATVARRFLGCTNEAKLRVFFNMERGLEYQEASIVLTEKDIRGKIDARGVRRRAPADTWAITVGVDVQKGRDDVVLYYTVVAWTSNGNAVILDFGKLLGWAALDALLRRFEAEQEGRAEPRRIRAGAVDSGWHTREVYEFCRLDHGGVKCVAVKHEPFVTRDEPTRKKPHKDPLHPEYGSQVRLQLCRDHWLDRVLGRFVAGADPTIGGSAILPPHTDAELVNHVKANRQTELIDRHGQIARSWTRDRQDPDDYAQAVVYAEVVAVGLGLDRQHEAVKPKPADPDLAGHVERKRQKRRPGGYIRGRRRRR